MGWSSMLAYILAIPFGLYDMLSAAFDLIARRRRRRYRASAVVEAAPDLVWSLMSAHDITYEGPSLRLREQPVPDAPGVYSSEVSLRGQPIATVAYERAEDAARRTLECRYRPDLSSDPAQFGETDTTLARVEPTGSDKSRVVYERTLTHRRLGTRITVPVGLRQAVWLVKTEAERRVRAARPPSFARRVLTEIGLALLAFLSFAWLVDWQDAAILLVLIALHELGHGIAMWGMGLGVRALGFVPFFGGLAVPRYPYQTQWQVGVVALAGPLFSLVPTLALVLIAGASPSRSDLHLLSEHAAVLFALVNALNLVPLSPLDGGLVLRSVLASYSPALARAGEFASVLALIGIGILLKSWIFGIVAALALLQLVQRSSLRSEQRLTRLSLGQALLLVSGYLATFGVLGSLTLRYIAALAA